MDQSFSMKEKNDSLKRQVGVENVYREKYT